MHRGRGANGGGGKKVIKEKERNNDTQESRKAGEELSHTPRRQKILQGSERIFYRQAVEAAQTERERLWGGCLREREVRVLPGK